MAQRILIVEDEKPMAEALSMKLRDAGYETVLTYDGEAAITLLGQSKFDLILLDLIIPKKDGFSVLEELKKLQITTPVIVSTNLSQDEDAEKAKALGAKDYFVKSDTPIAEVVERVKQTLGQS